MFALHGNEFTSVAHRLRGRCIYERLSFHQKTFRLGDVAINGLGFGAIQIDAADSYGPGRE